MDAGRLLLLAGLILAPPLAWSFGVIVYERRRRARLRAGRPSVADVINRVNGENLSSGDAGQDANHDPGARVPCGWHWPSRDPDEGQPGR